MKRSLATKVNHPRSSRPGSQNAHSGGQRQGAVAIVADIDAAALIHKLQVFVLGSDGNAMGEQQVTAAGALLNRVLSDLHRIDLRATGGQPFLVELANTASADDCPIAKIATK
jgi:hypothetical protein